VLNKILLVIAIAFGTINVVGGFLSPTGCSRCSRAARPKKKDDKDPRSETGTSRDDAATSSTSSRSLFIYGLMGLTGPRPRCGQPDRRGRHGDRGRRDAADRPAWQLGLIVARRRDRHGDRRAAARKVKMTAMPQMVALFNGVGGGAAR
jgi:hypothetical protein